MKSIGLSIALLTALPLAAEAGTTKEDIKKLAKAGVSDDVVLSFIRANGTIPNLTSDDVVELKAAGVSDRVLSALMTTARREEPVRTETRTEVVERKVYVPSTAVYYYDDCAPRYYYSCYPYTYYSYPSWSVGVYYGGGYSYRRGWGGYYYRFGWCW